MADPISLISLVFSGIRVATSIGTWMERRDSRKQAAEKADQAVVHVAEQNDGSEDILLVLSVIGQRLLILEVIDINELPHAHTAVRQTLAAKDEILSKAFDELDRTLQYAVTIAMFFCAACWPMHIYRGFGTGVLNDQEFGQLFWSKRPCFKTMDSAIAYLQSTASEVRVLTKIPVGLNRYEPDVSDLDGHTDAEEKVYEKKLKLYEEFLKAIEQRGLPQPKDKTFRLTTWHILAYTWTHRSFTFSPVQDNFRWAMCYQADAGKFFHAYTVGRHLELQDGEALFVLQGLTVPLLKWLEGLSGMTFKLIPISSLDLKPLKLSSKAKKLFVDDEVVPYFAVKDPVAVARVEAVRREEVLRLQNVGQEAEKGINEASMQTIPPSSSSPSQETTTSNPAVKRRPAPAPPSKPTLRRVKAEYDFVGEDKNELSFAMGDLLEILKEEEGDGWCEARLNGRVGIIPISFVRAV